MGTHRNTPCPEIGSPSSHTGVHGAPHHTLPGYAWDSAPGGDGIGMHLGQGPWKPRIHAPTLRTRAPLRIHAEPLQEHRGERPHRVGPGFPRMLDRKDHDCPASAE